MGVKDLSELEPSWARSVIACGTAVCLLLSVLIAAFGSYGAAWVLVDMGVENTDVLKAIVVLPVVAVGGLVGLGGRAAVHWAVLRVVRWRRTAGAESPGPAPLGSGHAASP